MQAFKPVVGKSLLTTVIAVEFLLDRQLDFLTDNSAYQAYQVMTKALLVLKYRLVFGSAVAAISEHVDDRDWGSCFFSSFVVILTTLQSLSVRSQTLMMDTKFRFFLQFLRCGTDVCTEGSNKKE